MIRVCPPLTAAVLLSCLGAPQAGAEPMVEESHQARFEVVTVADGLSHPWNLAFLPDGAMLVTEWTGTLRLIQNGKISEPIAGVPSVVTREGSRTRGLFTAEPHPNFEENGVVYLCYLSGTYEANRTRIARAVFDGDALSNLEVIFEAALAAPEDQHSGCRFVWAGQPTRDGVEFFVTLGDRRHHMEESQNLDNWIGTVLRLQEDGAPGRENPFLDTPTARPEIWAYGVRNVQGAARHPDTGEIWFSEHGPLGGDEVNILRRGANYGWPVVTYGIDYDGSTITELTKRNDVVQPLVYWRPSTAPSGLGFYTGSHFPEWRGDLFMGSLGDRRLIRMELDGDRVLFQEPLLAELDQRIRDVRMGPDGFLYVLTAAEPGEVLRLEPAEPARP